MIYNRIAEYAETYNLLSIHQYAAKMACGSEDCLIDMITDIDEMVCCGFPTVLTSNDSSSAYNAMFPKIIEDKMRFHCGFDDAAITMFRSFTSNVRSICKVNNQKSDVFEPVNSLFSQGFKPAGFAWCVYIDPGCRHLDEKYILYDKVSGIKLAKIQPKVLMDDVNFYIKLFDKKSNILNNDKSAYKKITMNEKI